MTQSFPWYKSYPAGVPHEINPDRYPSIPAVLDDIAARYPDKVGYTNMDCGLTYSRTAALTKELAAYLQSLGLKPGDRVAIMMPNLLQYVIAMYACLRAGYIVVNINPLYTSREVNGTLRDSEAKAIIIIENFAKTLQNALPGTKCEHIITTAVGDLFPFFKRTLVNFVVRKVKKMVPEYSLPNAVGFNEALEIGRRHGFTAHEIHNTDIAFLQYTGGTTGVAKGAILTHRNLLANLQQVGYWLASACKEGEEVALTALPLYHIFSLTATLSFTQFAANMVLITNPRDIDGLAKECAKWDFSIIVGVNTLFTAMLNNKIFCAHKFTRLKVTAGGGSHHRRTLEATDGLQHPRGLRSHGMLARRLRQHPRGSVGRLGGRAHPVDRSIHPRRRLPRPRLLPVARQDSRIHRRDLRARPAGHAGLLEQARGDGRRSSRRLAAHGRRGPHGHERQHHDHGPQEGHDSGLRLQRLSERSRKRDREHARRA